MRNSSTQISTALAPADRGEFEIAGKRYLSPPSLAKRLNTSVRTLARWNAARIGPPRIKIGKLVLYDLQKVPQWLAGSETENVRGRRGGAR